MHLVKNAVTTTKQSSKSWKNGNKNFNNFVDILIRLAKVKANSSANYAACCGTTRFLTIQGGVKR